jgi:uncharacterized protein YbbK (DUF523 family)
MAFMLEGRHVIAVCPEELGGLGTPRLACRISGGDGADGADVLDGKARVIDVDGNDRTEAFISGARAGLELALAGGAREAVLKERSPSCGVTSVYSGDNTGPGQGVFTALLARNGIPAVNESRAIRRKPRRSD